MGSNPSFGEVEIARKVVDGMPVGAAVLGEDGTVLFVNEKLESLLGASAERLVGGTFDSLLSAYDSDRLDTWLELDEDVREKLTVTLGNGERVVVCLDFHRLDPASGGGVLIVHDVTAGHQAAVARRRANLIDAVDAAVIATDLDRTVIEWSAGAEDLYGYSAEETVGRPAESFPIGAVDQEVRREIVRTVAAEGRWSGRYETVVRDGTVVPVYARVAQIHDDGVRVGSVAVISDITQQIEAEQAALRSEGYMQAVTDQMVEGLYSVDEHGCVTYINVAAERLLGYTHGDLVGRPMHETTHSRHPDGSPYPVEECPVTALREGEPGTRIVEEDVFVRSDGSLLPVAFTAATFESADGARGVLVVFRDISAEKAERDRLRRELESMSWVGPIRRALEHDSLLLHSQPIISLPEREIVQRELLVRMPDEDGGVVAAGQFMPAAEEHNLVGQIDRWVAPAAIRYAAESGYPVQFNLSAASIQDPAMPELIEEQLALTGVDPSLIVIEVTESGLIEQQAVAERFASRVVSAGIRLALDDFGTGYGGFMYLTRLPISILKIDQSFVRDLATNPSSLKVVQTIVGLADEFGQITIAEGVEDEEAMRILIEAGVDQAQGYVIDRPGPLEEPG